MLFVITIISCLNAQRRVESMDRGLVAMPRSGSQIYVSWRHFATDPDDIAYNLYYKTSATGTEIKLNSTPITNSTNFLANLSTSSSLYIFSVKSVHKGVEKIEPGSFTLPRNTIASRIVHDFNFHPLPAGHPTMMMKFCWPADLDGDGKFDFVLDRQNYGAVSEDGEGGTTEYASPKVEAYRSDGTFMWRIDMGMNIKICNGHNDMVTSFDMDGDGKAEVLMAVSEGTTFADGKMITGTNGQVTNYSVLPGSAPQWLSIVNGETGIEIDRVALPFFNDLATTRTDSWKEMGGHFVIAYLDGIRPSLIYHYRNRLANGNFQGAKTAWSFRNGKLQTVWATRNGGADFHQVRVADVDGDGRDNFVEGGYVLNHDGSILNHHQDVIHGDRHMLGDIDPDRPGFEHFIIQQNNPKTLGMGLFDALTGEMIKGVYQSAVGDVGRGICAAFDPTRRGLQFWSTMHGYAMYDSKGNLITGATGNFPAEAIWWGADLARWSLNGVNSSGSNVAFNKFNPSTRSMERDLPNLYNENNGNGTYYFAAAFGARAAFWGDLWGDWREEMIFVRSNHTGFVVLSTWEPTNHRLYHLMQNPAYRGQTTARGYYQSPDVDFYMAADMPKPPIAPVQMADLYHTRGGWINYDELPQNYADGKSIMYDIRGGSGNNVISMSANMAPSQLYLMNPKGFDYSFSGNGRFTGNMELFKSMQGTVIFNGQHDFTGTTRVSEGRLAVTGNYISPVQLDARGIIAGNATLSGGIILERGLNREGARIEPGPVNEPGSMIIAGNLNLVGRNNLAFKCDQTKPVKNSHLIIQGDFNVSGGNNSIIIQPLTPMQEGSLTLISFTGTTNASPESFTIVGMEGIPYTLKIENQSVKLEIAQSRMASRVIWTGNQSMVWDFKTPNFRHGAFAGIFVPGDSITFDDSATRKSISISETMPVGGMIFTNNTDYSITGQGVISGSGGLTKTGSGRLSIQNTENTFTGKVEIDGGILEVSSLKDGGLPSSIGASSSASGNWIMRNATLQTRAQMSSNRIIQVTGSLTVNNPNTNNSVLLSGNIQGSNVTLILNGTGTLTLQGNNSLSNVHVNSGLLLLGSADGNRNSMGNARITLNGGTFRMFDINTTSNTGTFGNEVVVPEGKSARWDTPSRWGISSRLVGAGILQFNAPFVRTDLNGDWSQFSGRINFTGRDVRLNSAISRNIPLAEVNLGEGTFLYVATNGSSESSTGQTFTFGALSGSGGISGRNSLIVGERNTNTTYSGVINSGSGRITKRGTSALTLTGANLYTGGTFVETGRIYANNATGSATGTGTVSISHGASLAGTGTIAGSVTVQSGAVLTAGATETGIGNLKLSSNLTMRPGSTLQIKTNNTLSDRISVTGTVDISGSILEMINPGTAYTVGRTYTIFTAGGSVSGSFERIEPAIPAVGLAWDTTQISSGIIAVTHATNLNQVNMPKLNVYPTITSQRVNIINILGDEKLTIELRSLTGSLLFREDIYQRNHSIDISNFTAGCYILFASNGDWHETRYIIKK